MTNSIDIVGVGVEQIYREALNTGNFVIQRCTSCCRHVFYPRELCPFCGSTILEWVAPTGNGVVYSTTVVRRRKDVGGDLNVALIDLEEGVRLMSRVEGLKPEDVAIGLLVRAHIEISDDKGVLMFRPADYYDLSGEE